MRWSITRIAAYPVLLRALSAPACAARRYLLNDRRLRLLPERTGRAVNGILKNELLTQCPQNLTQARQMVREAVEIYNRERPHQALKYETPAAVHRAF